MTDADKKYELRQHLALISTEVYLLLRATDEEKRIDCYNIVQQQIDAILRVIDDQKPAQSSCPDVMLQ